MFKKLLALFLVFSFSIAPMPHNEAKAFMLGGYATTASCAYTPPLDSVSGGVAAYSFRLLRTAWSGSNVVRIQRSSDSTQKDFTASIPSCTINTADAFFDGSTYTVVTWYDQSGGGVDVTQGTNANRPTVTLNCQNAHPCAVFASASSQRLSGTSGNIASSTWATVVKLTDQSNSHGIAAVSAGTTDGTGLLYSFSINKCAADRVITNTSIRGTETCSNNTWYRMIATNTNVLSSIYLNGVVGTDDTSSHTLNNATAVTIGFGFTVYMQGNIGEVIAFAPSLSITDSNTVSSNQGSYWGI